MGRTSEPENVRLFTGLTYRESKVLEKTFQALEAAFGKVSLRSPEFNFDFTDYYNKEMGQNLKKIFIGFVMPINPGRLTTIKKFTNELEERFGIRGKERRVKRKINIDPGYVDHEKVVLASTKNRSQRIYMGEGIYAEITLLFKGKSFVPLPWTYPDFRTPLASKFFTELKDLL
jgi:hypothetical protein